MAKVKTLVLKMMVAYDKAAKDYVSTMLIGMAICFVIALLAKALGVFLGFAAVAAIIVTMALTDVRARLTIAVLTCAGSMMIGIMLFPSLF